MRDGCSDDSEFDEDCDEFPGLDDLLLSPTRRGCNVDGTRNRTAPIFRGMSSRAGLKPAPPAAATVSADADQQRISPSSPLPEWYSPVEARELSQPGERIERSQRTTLGAVAADSDRELAALRPEVALLREARAAAERETIRLQRRAEGDQKIIEDLRSSLAVELRRSATLKTELARERSGGGAPDRGSTFESPCSTRKRSAGCGKSLSSSCSVLSEEDDAMAVRLAEIELRALDRRLVDGDEARSRFRRRLQMKWHPDKNAHNLSLATRVLQEMQCQPEWQ